MKVLFSIISSLLIVYTMTLSPFQVKAALSVQDHRHITKAFKAADKKHWKTFNKYAAQVQDPLAKKILFWIEIRRPNNSASFEDIATFITDNPDWPSQTLLRRRAEEAMTMNMPNRQVLAWFSTHTPVSVDGGIQYGAALLKAGFTEMARTVLRRTWIKGNFGRKQEYNFRKDFGSFLAKNDHKKRLNRLLWEERYGAANRMLHLVGPKWRALAVARLKLAQRKIGVDQAIAAVSPQMRNNEGLLYERLRWRRRKERYKGAHDILLFKMDGTPLTYPNKWWKERAILARTALQNNQAKNAYRLVVQHGLSHGVNYAEAEWLAGWIALRFLGHFEKALKHFSTLYSKVKYPISRARASYWAGRASEALGREKDAASWYEIAASLPTTYYGQLANMHHSPQSNLTFLPDPVPSTLEINTFAKSEVVKATRLLGKFAQKTYLTPFITAVSKLLHSPGWYVLSANLAIELGYPDLAIRVSSLSLKKGWILLKLGFPILPLPSYVDKNRKRLKLTLEDSLVYALIRQESAFNPIAISPAGARGLMQIRPAIARRIAQLNGKSFSRRRLTTDPDYNLMLGQIYLTNLLERYDKSYVLALVAYNAGMTRLSKWIKQFGDPRSPDIDIIDWIERIPFKETRNHVQRVLEAVYVYRYLRLHNNLHNKIISRIYQ